MFAQVKLLRGNDDPRGISLVGDLLKQKADNGVRVLMMVWNDATSGEYGVMSGIMGTHDQETKDFGLGSTFQLSIL